MNAPHRATADDDHPPAIGPRLQADWDVLACRPAAIERARSWGVTSEPFADLHELLLLAGHRSRTAPAYEAVLGAILTRASDDDLAARVVLQRMIPGLLGIVRRRASGGGTRGLLEELVGAAWITIRTWDRRRQPPCIAAALVWGAEHRAFRSSTRRMSSSEVVLDTRLLDRMAPPPGFTPTEELARLLREARAAGVAPDDLAFVRQLVQVQSPADLARTLGVTSRTVRNRRDRVTYRLRRVALAV